MPTAANQVCGRPSYRRNLTPCQFVRVGTVRRDGRVKVIRGRTQLVEGKTVKLFIAGGIGNTNPILANDRERESYERRNLEDSLYA